MKYLLILLFPALVQAKTLRVAVIDGGFHEEIVKDLPICPGTEIIKISPVLSKDHGTNVAGLIDKFAENKDFCLILIQGLGSIEYSILSLAHAINQGADIINYSGGGFGNENWQEKYMIDRFIESGGVMFAAAGNGISGKGVNLEEKCSYFPACYNKKINIIGNFEKYSNYGRNVIKLIEDGKREPIYHISLKGTSQSTAIATGLYIKVKGEDK